MKRYKICMLTCRSTAVRLIGASLGVSDRKESMTHVAFRMSFVSCPAFTTTPYTHSVFLSWAPRNNI
jgi:hypothetical protein